MQLGSLIFNSKDKFTFQWTAAAGAASYRFSLIDERGSVVKSGVVTGETHTETIHNQDFCTWQVEALDAAGNVIASERSPEIWFGDEGKEWYKISALSPNLICMVMTQDFHDYSAPLNYYLAHPDKYTRPIVSFRCSDPWPNLALDDTLLLMDGELYVKNGSRYDFYGTLMQSENISPRMSADSSGFFSLNTTVYRYSGGRAVRLFTLPCSGGWPEIYFLNSQIAVTDSGVWRIAGTEPELAGTFDFPLPDAGELTISGKYAVSYGYEGDSMISYRIDSRGNVSRLPDVPLSLPSGYQASEIDLQGNRVALLASDWEGGNRLSVYEISGDMWKLIHEQAISGFDLTLFWKDNSTVMLRDQAEDRLSSIRLPADSGAAPMEPDNIDGLAAQVKQYSVTVKWNKSSIRNCTYELLVDGLGSVVTKSNKFTFKDVPVGRYSGSVRVIAPDGNAGEWSESYTVSVADVTAPKLGKVTAAVNGYTGVISWNGSDNVGVEYYEVRCAGQVKTATGTSVEFDHLAVGKYHAEVTAFDAAGNASKTGKVKITVRDATPPERVTGLAVPVVDGKYKATLSWDTGVDNSGKVANYEILLDNGKILKSGKTSIGIGKLSVGEHSYRVRAVDKNKNVGEWSEVQTFTVRDMTAPTSVKARATVNGYTVSFALSGKDNSGSIAGYVVTCGDKKTQTTTSTAVLSDFGVGKQTAYVVAYDAEGNASKETKVSFTVKDATPPEKVTGLAVPVVDGKYKATLSWDTGVDNSGKVANYEILLDNGKILKSGKTSIGIGKLSVGEHSYRVRAVDKNKNVGEWSEVQTFTVRDMTAPGNVSVKAKVEENSLLLSWKTPKDNVGVTGYILKHGANLEHSEFLAADKLAFRIDGITKGSYQYQLIAVDAEGNESKPKNGKATIKTDLPTAELNQELPDAAQLAGFDSGVQAIAGLVDDPLAFCRALRLDAELKLSAAELLDRAETGRRPAPLFTAAS